MAKTKIVLNTNGIKTSILQDADIAKFCKDVAQARLPDGCEISEFVGYDRTHIILKATTDEAKRDNLENNTLLKAVSR